MDLAELCARVRSCRGVVRKAPIGAVARSLIPHDSRHVVAAQGEDAAAIQQGRGILLIAADGIIQDLVDKNPEWAGYCSVLVNANDIAAMGGLPVAAVNVLSCGDAKVRAKIVKGMRQASDKFGVPMVGGHLHPDTAYSAIDVAMVGRTTPRRLVLSSGARAGDHIMFAMDLDGRFTPGIPYSWDTTSQKGPEEVRRRLAVMHAVAPYLTAGKDISNPGSLGTLGMLLEASSRGGAVDLERVPTPEGVDLLQWLLAYQGCGFVLTSSPDRSDRVSSAFDRAGLTCSVCGRVTGGRRLELRHSGRSDTLFELSRDTFGCRPPQKI